MKKVKVTFLGRRLTLRFDKIESHESENEINDLENLSLEEKYFEIKPDTIFVETSKQNNEETKQQSENVNKLTFNRDVLETLENRNRSNWLRATDYCLRIFFSTYIQFLFFVLNENSALSIPSKILKSIKLNLQQDLFFMDNRVLEKVNL